MSEKSTTDEGNPQVERLLVELTGLIGTIEVCKHTTLRHMSEIVTITSIPMRDGTRRGRYSRVAEKLRASQDMFSEIASAFGDLAKGFAGE